MAETAKYDPDTADVMSLVMIVMLECSKENGEVLRELMKRMRDENKKKQALRAYLLALRKFRAKVMAAAHKRGVDLCNGGERASAVLAGLFGKHALAYEVSDVAFELCIPNRVPRADVSSFASLDNEIALWEEELNAIGYDSQLANIDLQDALQKRQQYLQMISNVSKMTHDTAMSIIRNMGC
jgi:hypothetical protein